MNEADTCKDFVIPRLVAAGWDSNDASIAAEYTFTDGRIIATGATPVRLPRRRADYLLRFRSDLPIAVVEAKRAYKQPADGLQQAMRYAEILGLRFAYATNGAGIVEHDYCTGVERQITAFPPPAELWARLRAADHIHDDQAEKLLTGSYHHPSRQPRYYQQIAIQRVVQAIVNGQQRILLTMATGTGKTEVAFQICWKLWNGYWNRIGSHRRPRILFLADRRVLVDDPKDKTFAPFGDARTRLIQDGVPVTSRDIYFSTYQAIAEDEGRPGMFRAYPRDFFDLIIIDECHRGSSSDESSWRRILDYFAPAVQLGMTATPLRAENRDTYDYFGDPIYMYSLRQGIEDGFLAPYRVHRIVTTLDATGWRPMAGELDLHGQEVPDAEYGTADFERTIVTQDRTEAIARHLSQFMQRTGRFAKTIVFCVDQEHALAMRQALSNQNADLVLASPDYVCRVTADEGEIGAGHLGRFQDLETVTPTILTTSQMLTTGVDAPTCHNIVIVRPVNSMVEFKQIIGRGTRVRDDYGKLYFTILDYTGSATRNFADPEFDGDPVFEIVEQIDANGEIVAAEQSDAEDGENTGAGTAQPMPVNGAVRETPLKYYVNTGGVGIAAEVEYVLDAEGHRLTVREVTERAGATVRSLFGGSEELRAAWSERAARAEVLLRLGAAGVDVQSLGTALRQPDADPFDLLCHLAYGAPLHSRRERVDRLRREQQQFMNRYGPEARAVLAALLDKYAEAGPTQLDLPDALKVKPISEIGNASEIARLFGGVTQLSEAVQDLQALIYAA